MDAKLVSKLTWFWEKKMEESQRRISNTVTVFLVSNNTPMVINLGRVSPKFWGFQRSYEISRLQNQ